MNYKEECVRLGLRLVSELRRKYESDNYDRVFSEKVITKVCFDYIYRKDFKKNYIYFTELLKYVDSKITRGVYSSEIFNAIDTIAKDIKKDINNKELIIKSEKEKFEEDTKLSIRKRLDYLEDKKISREELELLEKVQVLDSMDNYKHYKEKTARGKAIGSLNKGFYSMSLNDLSFYIKDNGGKQGSKKNRFIKIMPIELLKYRVVLMEIARVYSIRSKEKNISLEELREKMYTLGEIGRDMFTKEYFNVPEDVLLKSSLGKISNNREEQLEMNLKIRK